MFKCKKGAYRLFVFLLVKLAALANAWEEPIKSINNICNVSRYALSMIPLGVGVDFAFADLPIKVDDFYDFSPKIAHVKFGWKFTR